MSIQLQEIKNIFIKNRLTEGVDFVRKEWLDSTSGQISLTINETDFQSLTMYRIGNPNSGVMMTTHPNYGVQEMFFNFESWIPGFALYNPSKSYIKIKEQNLQFTLTKNGNNIIYQGNSTITINYPMNKLISIFVSNNMTRLKSISTSTGQYLPCKLLQDIPASLSIDNKAYTADTCGLYYTTTGKFIGNSNLTVEGEVEPETHTGLQQIYQNKLIEGVDYETYDWLKGDGIINYDKPIDYLSDNLRIKIRNLDSNSGYNTIWVGGETNPGKNDWSRCIIDFEVVNGVAIKQVQWCEYVHGGSYQHFPTSSDNIYTFDININRAIINGVTYSMTSSRCNVTTPFVITLREADSIAYCKLNNVDMYPCKLIKTIPRNLDAQCKERVAGECGMIDLISGKFYGNVANSGTFTVENDNNE